MTYLDKTFCASANCEGKCGRKMTDEELTYLQRHEYLNVSYAYFCGGPHEEVITLNHPRQYILAGGTKSN